MNRILRVKEKNEAPLGAVRIAQRERQDITGGSKSQSQMAGNPAA
jgi:hypothetical protein